MAEEALARQKKAQRVLAEAYAQADVAATVEDRARLRANARLEAELLTEVCDYVQADMVRSIATRLRSLMVTKALKDCRFSAPWKIFIPSACQSEMAALAKCRKTRCAISLLTAWRHS